MKSLSVFAMTCALMVGMAAAQSYPSTPDQQNPQTYPQSSTDQQTYPQSQQSYPQGQQTYPSGQNQSYPQGQQTYPSQQASSNYGPNTIPSGTQIKIRTNQNIDATKESVGQTYQAEIADNVMGPNGEVIIPKGSPAMLAVQKVSSGTMGVQSNEVALGLQSVSINGRQYNVASNTVSHSSDRGIGANKRTAEMTGGGALLGTLVGAMAGGGKGAAIGAAIGGAGGAAAQVATRGSNVKVPAETVMTFQLDQPISLQ